MYMYMYTCKRMSCIYSMSCIYLCISISSQSRSRHYLARCQRRKFLFENVGVFEVHELHEYFLVHSEHCGRRVLGRKCLFWRGKNCYFEPKGVDLYPPRGVTMGKGREWESPERNDSRNHSRKYSQELWEVTSLFLNPHASAPSTAETHNDGGAVIRKRMARRCNTKLHLIFGVSTFRRVIWTSPDEGIGTPYLRLRRKLQQFSTKGYQAERNRCDNKGNL